MAEKPLIPLRNKLIIKDLTIGKIVYKYSSGSIELLNVDSVNDLLDLLNKLNQIKNFKMLDPPYYVLWFFLIFDHCASNVPFWWCDYGLRGKLFKNVNLCTIPPIDHMSDGRRAIALNPWSLDNLGDLDTIIDSSGYHKSGTIGTEPFSFSRTISATKVTLHGEFMAASNTTIRSVIILCATYYFPHYFGWCVKFAPAPFGTCDPNYYASIYMPIWGFNIEAPIEQGHLYSVDIIFYL